MAKLNAQSLFFCLKDRSDPEDKPPCKVEEEPLDRRSHLNAVMMKFPKAGLVDYTLTQSSGLVAKLGSAHTVDVETYGFPCEVCAPLVYIYNYSLSGPLCRFSNSI